MSIVWSPDPSYLATWAKHPSFRPSFGTNLSSNLQTPVRQPQAPQMNDGNLCLVIAAFHPGILPCNLQGATARAHTLVERSTWGGDKWLRKAGFSQSSWLIRTSHRSAVREWIIRPVARSMMDASVSEVGSPDGCTSSWLGTGGLTERGLGLEPASPEPSSCHP